MTCSSVMTALVSCSITVSLSGLAKDIQGECKAEYKDTRLISMGRQVPNCFYKNIPCNCKLSAWVVRLSWILVLVESLTFVLMSVLKV